MQQLIFPDKEQFYEEVSGYNSDGNLARRDAKHGEYDFGFLLPMNSKKIISDIEKVGGGSLNVT